MNRLRTIAGALVVLGAALAGCSTVIQGGPLGREMDPPGSDTQGICMQRGDVVVDGFNSIPNSGRQMAVIDKVAFDDPVGLRQIAAYVIPDNGPLYGDQTGYPPDGAGPSPGLDWSARQNAAGARIPPTPGPPNGPNVQLMVVAQSSGDKASEQGINVWYHVGSQHYHLRTPVRMIAVVPDRGHC